MKITLKDIEYMVNESVKHIVKEGWKPIYRHTPNGDYDYDGDEWDGVNDNEEEEVDERQRKLDNEEFDSYVVINDSDGSLIATYSVDNITDFNDQTEKSNEAQEFALEQALKDKYGTYSVFATIDNQYDDDTLVATYNHDEAVEYFNRNNQ